MEKRLFTSESVTEGHPDKICDQISDAILDALIEKDPYSRVACETAITTDFVLIMGEITTKADINIEDIVRKTINEIGYDNPEYGFDGHTCKILIRLDSQSDDIALGVNNSYESKTDNDSITSTGAGDQGMMFGYATSETPDVYALSGIYCTQAYKKTFRSKKKRYSFLSQT